MNGEIYNHEQLRAQLSSHTFRTGSDCEVIAHLVSHVATRKNVHISKIQFAKLWNTKIYICHKQNTTSDVQKTEMIAG